MKLKGRQRERERGTFIGSFLLKSGGRAAKIAAGSKSPAAAAAAATAVAH